MKTAPPRLVVHALPGKHGQEVAHTLADMTQSDSKSQEPVSADVAGQQLAKDAEATLCIVYQDPISALCAVMSAKGDINAFLRNWSSCASQALALHRHNRKRSMIYEAGHLQRFAAAGLARLNIEADSRNLGEIADTAPPPAPLDYILAQAILAEDAEAQAAHNELSASAQVLSNEENLAPADMALRAYETLREQTEDDRQALRQELEDKTARIELLLAQQAEMISDMDALEETLQQNEASFANEKARLQKELEDKKARNSLLIDQQTAMIADMDVLEKELEATNTRAKHMQHDLLAQLQAADDAKEHIVIERDQRTAELKAALETQERTAADLAHRDEELAAAHAEIERIMNSRSMRLTSSLRSISNLLRGRR